MNIMFVYPNLTRQEYIPMGIAHLSSFLKARGHKVSLIDYTWGGTIKTGLRRIEKEKPDLIGLSILSGNSRFSLELSKAIKSQTDVKIIAGGPHPTVEPEDVLRTFPVDGVCVGEGEGTCLEVVERLENNLPLEGVEGFWTIQEGKVNRPPVRRLVCNLDTLPNPDRDLFDLNKYLAARNGVLDVISGRGCPYQCSYCINQVLQDIYRGRGQFVRKRSVDNVISEIHSVMKQYNVRSIAFQDDVFILSKSWLREFHDKYPKEIGLPYTCSARPEQVNAETVEYLKASGCESVGIGVESGDEQIRHQILNRKLSDQDIISAYDLVNESGMGSYAFNIIGLPTEKEEHIEKTIALNKRLKPTSLQVTIFQPFPGTKLRELVLQKGWLAEDKDLPVSHKFYSVLKYPYISKQRIERARLLFRYHVAKDENRMKALSFLIFDVLFSGFTRVRNWVPIPIKTMMFKLDSFFRKTKQM